MTLDEAVSKLNTEYQKHLNSEAKQQYFAWTAKLDIDDTDGFENLSKAQFTAIRKRVASATLDAIKSEYEGINSVSRGYDPSGSVSYTDYGIQSDYAIYKKNREDIGLDLQEGLLQRARRKVNSDKAILEKWAMSVVNESAQLLKDFNVSYSMEGDKVKFNVEQKPKKKVTINVKNNKKEKEISQEISSALEQEIKKLDERIEKNIRASSKGNFQTMIKNQLQGLGLYTKGKKPPKDERNQSNWTPTIDLRQSKNYITSNNRANSQHRTDTYTPQDFSMAMGYIKSSENPEENLIQKFDKKLKNIDAVKEKDLRTYTNLRKGPIRRRIQDSSFEELYANLKAYNEEYVSPELNSDYLGMGIFEDKDYASSLRELLDFIEEIKGDYVGGRIVNTIYNTLSPTELLLLDKKERKELRNIATKEKRYFRDQINWFKNNFTTNEGDHPLKGAVIEFYTPLNYEDRVEIVSGEPISEDNHDNIITKSLKSLGNSGNIYSYSNFYEYKELKEQHTKAIMVSNWNVQNMEQSGGFGLNRIRLNEREIKVPDTIDKATGKILEGGLLDKAEIKQFADIEAQMAYELVLKVAGQNYDLVRYAIKALDEKRGTSGVNDNRQKLLSGDYVEIIDPKTKFIVVKKRSEVTKEELEYGSNRELVGFWQDVTSVPKDLIERTLRDGIKAEVARAQKIWDEDLALVRAQTKTNQLAKMPTFPKTWIEQQLDNQLKEHLSIYEQYMKLNKRASTRNKITPKSAMLGVGTPNIFNGGFEVAISYLKRQPEVVTGTKQFTSAQVKKTWNNEWDIDNDEYEFKKEGSKHIFVRKSSLKPLDVRDKLPKKKKGLLPLIIPKKWLMADLTIQHYGSLVAAGFFQLLVSNTPIDEPYDYIERRKYIKKGKAKYTDEMVTKDGKRIKYELPDEEIYEQWTTGSSVEYKEIKRHHEPDTDVVRNDWEFNYKGRIFKPTDKCFEGKDIELFGKPGDRSAIAKIAVIFEKETAKSKIRTHNFTYKNTNKRWEQLEYGGYPNSNSGPWKGSGKYQKEHGVKDHFTYQAPHGWLRLIEAQWNMVFEQGSDFDFVEAFIKEQASDVSVVAEEFVEKLKKYDPSIGTRGYDLQNWVVMEVD